MEKAADAYGRIAEHKEDPIEKPRRGTNRVYKIEACEDGPEWYNGQYAISMRATQENAVEEEGSS